ncbi:MAG: M56 family metallopeptidase [Isosphaeraceae bacterium]
MESLVQGILSNAVAVTVLAVLVAVLGRACRRPALIHSLCLLAILKLVTPPIVPLAVPLPSSWRPSAAPVPIPDEAGVIAFDYDPERELEEAGLLEYLDGKDRNQPRAEPAGDDRLEATAPPVEWPWEPIVLAAMLAGAMAWWMLTAVRIVRFHRVLRDVEPMPADWQARIVELSGRLNLRRPPVVCMVPGDVPPMLWAIGVRPRLLVPRQLWASLDEEQRTALVLHELAHLKRRDHWVRWIELVVAGLYWWHPAVWWLRRALREAEEQCCDAWVVWAMPRGARTYATALVAALEFVSGVRNVPAVATVAASATIGNGHVSSLKRRLRMIVRAKTPKGLSLVGRLAVAGLAALLLPLAPSWAQKDTPESSHAGLDQRLRSADQSIRADMTPDNANTARAIAQVALAQDTSKPVDPKARRTDKPLDTRIADGLKTDPELAALDREIEQAKKGLSNIKRVVRDFNHDPAAHAYSRRLEDLIEKQKELRASRRAELVTLQKSDDKDEKAKDDKGRSTAERIEKQLKDLVDRLGKDVSPVGEEVRKALERSVSEIHRALEKEGMTADDLRSAVEKSREDLRKSFEPGGPVQKEMREAAERARKEMHDAMERGRHEAERMREEMHKQMEEIREQQRKMAEEGREAQKKAPDDRRRADRRREPLKGGEVAKPDGADRSNRDELDAARKQIRDLQQQLQSATRRLNDLQQRDSRRVEPPARPAEPRRAERPARPATPATPARPAAPARPEAPRDKVQPGRDRDDNDRRFRELEEKMNRLLKELEELKGRKTSAVRTWVTG